MDKGHIEDRVHLLAVQGVLLKVKGLIDDHLGKFNPDPGKEPVPDKEASPNIDAPEQ